MTLKFQRNPMRERKNGLRIGTGRLVTALVVVATAVVGSAAAGTPALELKPGDHICFIGNTLADRMQHHGWLETMLQARFPQHRLVIRNLGFSADEITVRPRSMNFGTPDEHLTRCKADVIFAFFGYNESFGGAAGLPKFRKDLEEFIDHTLGQKYNGHSPPRLVIFSPIAHEDLKNRLLPDGRENNARLELYTRAMAEVAASKGVPFVDLFGPTKALYEQATEPLTINGIHLTVEGNRRLAEVIVRSLFGGAIPGDEAYLQRLRQAVLDKNLHWFNVYRTTDGYNVFGGRSRLKYVDGQTNYDVLQRELQILEVMTANRDRRIWAIAGGGDLQVDDSNTPPPLVVKTNKPGPLEGGRHIFLGGEEAIQKMQVAKGMKVNLFASEEMFPELVNPVQAAVDPDGRLWVAAWPTYPHWNPKKEMNDKLLILPDDDGDGKADRCIVFADHLHNPTGFEFFAGGVLLAQAPDIVFLKDTDGDDRADLKIRVLHGLDSADTHHTANSFVIGPDGGLYFQRGIFHVTNVETPWGPPFRSTSTGMYRFDPRTWQFDLHFKIGPNPHGDVFDKWGYQFATDGTSGTGYYVAFPKHGTPKQLYTKRFRPVPAIQILSSEHFPPENQGNLLICNVIGFQGVGQYKFIDQGAGFHAVEIEPILVSSDPNFRPVDLEIAGDGALYVLDWQNPLIGHMQHNLRDPNRDHEHGRVYRVSVPGRPLMKPIKMKGRPIREILDHLTSPTNSVRYRARLELTGRDDFEVAKAAAQWAEQWDPNNPDHALPLVEALWLHQQHKVVNVSLLKKVLQSVEPNARAAAVRVLREWTPKVPDAYEILIRAANDEHPRVRHEAVVAAALNPGPLSAEVIFAAEQWPTDQQLEYTLREARKEIDVDAYIQHALATNRKLSPAARQYMLKNASVEQLLKLEKSDAVYRAILTRRSVPAAARREALLGWAKLAGREPVALLLELIADLDRRQQTDTLGAYADLVRSFSTGQWRPHLRKVRRLVHGSRTAAARRLGYLAWMIGDGHVDDAYAYAIKSEDRFREFLAAAA
ncbi:MAG: dehydrogenase, partial [Planctomycetota bacterium]